MENKPACREAEHGRGSGASVNRSRLLGKGVGLVAGAGGDFTVSNRDRRPPPAGAGRKGGEDLELVGGEDPEVPVLVHAVDLVVGARGRGAEDGFAAEGALPEDFGGFGLDAVELFLVAVEDVEAVFVDEGDA